MLDMELRSYIFLPDGYRPPGYGFSAMNIIDMANLNKNQLIDEMLRCVQHDRLP